MARTFNLYVTVQKKSIRVETVDNTRKIFVRPLFGNNNISTILTVNKQSETPIENVSELEFSGDCTVQDLGGGKVRVTVSSSGGGASWGGITGTLSNQTDLQNALNDKQNALGFTPENVANKATDLTSPDNTKYPTTQAVVDGLATKFELPALTSGSVLFSNGSTIAQDNSNLFFDDVNNRLGIGTTSPQARLDVRAQGALSTDIAFRVRNSADSANLVTVQGNGNVGIGNITPTRAFEVRGISKFVTGSLSPAIIVARNVGQGVGEIQFGDENGNNSISGGSQVSGFRYFSQIHHSFFNNTIESLRIFSNTRNVQIQNGGTFTDIPSARLAVNSTTQGFLPPRMTNAERLEIASPAVGLIVYCTDATEGLYVNKSTGWTFVI